MASEDENIKEEEVIEEKPPGAPAARTAKYDPLEIEC